MITGNSLIDNELNKVTEEIKKSLKTSETEQNELFIKLKNASRKEREFIIFKTYFNNMSEIKKEALHNIVKKHPFIIDKFFHIIEEANASCMYSAYAISNRNICCEEIMMIYQSLLEDMSKLAKEFHFKNSLELSILFSYLLWNGYLSKTKKHTYREEDKEEILGLLFTAIMNGNGVCRNYSEMLKDFLNYNGYNSVILVNCLDNIKVDYQMNIGKKTFYQFNVSNSSIFKKKKANHTFNLIEDKGIYIYDSTNLLLYSLENQKSAVLINGKGKNKIYPYRSYDFCYSSKEEKLLDKIIMEGINMPISYNKTDFISTSEVNIDQIKTNIQVIEDFYTEIHTKLIDISKEISKKKTLTK